MLARSALGSKAQLTLTLCPDLEMPLPILVVIEIGNGTWPPPFGTHSARWKRSFLGFTQWIASILGFVPVEFDARLRVGCQGSRDEPRAS